MDQLKNKLGFDEAFNYKEEADFNSALKRLVCNNVLIDKYEFILFFHIKKMLTKASPSSVDGYEFSNQVLS